MARLDKELYDRLPLKEEDVTYVPLPPQVAHVIKRRLKDEILVSLVKNVPGEQQKRILTYFARNKKWMPKMTNGYASSKLGWEELAKEIASKWPQYKTERKVNNSYDRF